MYILSVLRESLEAADGVSSDVWILVGIVQQFQSIFWLEWSPCQQHRLQLREREREGGREEGREGGRRNKMEFDKSNIL